MSSPSRGHERHCTVAKMAELDYETKSAQYQQKGVLADIVHFLADNSFCSLFIYPSILKKSYMKLYSDFTSLTKTSEWAVSEDPLGE